MERLAALGTGLLLGAALGVIIPECVQPTSVPFVVKKLMSEV